MTLDRRQLLVAAAASGAALSRPLCGGSPTTSASAPLAPPAGYGPILSSVKWGMIRVKGDVMARFELMKELGFDGVELVSPLGTLKIPELLKARDATGLPIHGVVDMVHWKKDYQLSSDDPASRERGRKALEQAIRDAHALGGSSVLLVPAVVRGKASHDLAWERSTAEVKKVLPLCARLGIHVLVENVWNGFCQTAELTRDYIDGFNSPWIGSYFDIGNHVKFGPAEHWVRTLGKRIVKLDVKDWGKKTNWAKIGDGDANWPEVRKALGEIGFTGWSTAEVGGGGKDRLAEIKARMDEYLIRG